MLRSYGLLAATTALALAAGCGSPNRTSGGNGGTGGSGAAATGGSQSGGSAGTSTGGPPVGVTDLLAVEEPNNVLAYDVSWKTSRNANTELDVSCDTLAPWTISDSKASSTAHHIFLMGLATGVSCTLTAKAKASDGGSGSAKTTITVSDLPSYLPPMTLTVPGTPAAISPGWTLINLSNTHTWVPYVVALIDSKGRYRWYFQYPSTDPGDDTPVSAYADGVLIGGRGIPMSYVTWQGEVVWKNNSGVDYTHEARAASTPNQFYTIAGAPCANLTAPGATIVVWDSVKKTDIWTWYFCDHYTPPQDVGDWSHLNSVVEFADPKFLLTSSRNQNSLLKIERATGNVVWVMGFHGEVEDGFHGDFTIADADRFYHQHDATLLPNGHILLFDNGRVGVREYSRGLELAYTYNPSGTSEAHVVWEFRHNPDIFSDVWGSAQRLSNSDTLISFGERTAGTHSTIVEASSASNLVWEFQAPEYFGIYRAERIARKYGSVLP